MFCGGSSVVDIVAEVSRVVVHSGFNRREFRWLRQGEDEQKRFSSPGFSSLPGLRGPMSGLRVYVVGEGEVSIA